MDIHFHQISMILGLIISIIVLVAGWPRRKIIGGGFFIGFCVSVTLWLIASTVESFVTKQETKILWSQISYIGFVQAYPYLFLFIINYVRQRDVPIRLALSVLTIPFLTLLVVWIKPLQSWVWSGFSQGSVEYNVLIYHHGFWFWIHTIYLYILLAGGLILLLKSYVKATGPFRQQLLIIILGLWFPVITGTTYALGLVPIEGMDITPTGLAFTGAFMAWALLRYQLLDLLPVARATLIEQLQDGVIILDKNAHVADINLATQKLLGWSVKESIGKEIELLFPGLRNIFFSTSESIRKEVPLPDSPGIILEIQSSSLNDNRNKEVGKLLVIRDVTSRNRAEADLQNANTQLKEQLEKNKQLQKKLEQQALHDSLTGLYNRRIDEILIKEFSRARRENKTISLAMIDIDHFKRINDKHGHQDGDLLLKTFCDYITKNTRKEDYAARYGGDEIMLIFPGMNKEDAINKAEEIRKAFTKIIIGKSPNQETSTLSVGVAAFPQNGTTVDEVIRSADWALYLAKEDGRNCVKSFDGMISR